MATLRVGVVKIISDRLYGEFLQQLVAVLGMSVPSGFLTAQLCSMYIKKQDNGDAINKFRI